MNAEVQVAEHPLVRRLVDSGAAAWIDAAGAEAFAAAPGHAVLFLPGPPGRYPDSSDVAVVLAEIAKAFPTLRVGVAVQADAAGLAKRWQADRWPALVFLAAGQRLRTMYGISDWDVSLRQVAQIMASPSSAG
jgi:hydrogenase-1 operon protein HyaE